MYYFVKHLLDGSLRNIEMAKAKEAENNRIYDRVEGYVEEYLRCVVAGKAEYFFYVVRLFTLICSSVLLGGIVTTLMTLGVGGESLPASSHVRMIYFGCLGGSSWLLVISSMYIKKFYARRGIFPDALGLETLRWRKEMLTKKENAIQKRKDELQRVVNELPKEIEGVMCRIEEGEEVCRPIIITEWMEGERRIHNELVVEFWRFEVDGLKKELIEQLERAKSL